MRYLKTTIAIVLASCMGTAQAEKTFAHSESLDMRFIAQGTPWCKPTVDMRVEAGDPGNFGTSDFHEIVGKLGTVLVRECPDASELVITGVHDGRIVWSGSAAKAERWEPVARRSAGDDDRVASDTSGPESQADGVSGAAPAAATVRDGALEIAGWSPRGLLTVSEDAGQMRELTDESGNCRVTLFLEDIRWELDPYFKPPYEKYFDCRGGYLVSKGQRGRTIFLYYRGQKEQFDRFYGNWVGGFNLDSGKPEKLVRRYSVEDEDGERHERLLAWLGEDRDLRTHYFGLYQWNGAQWDLMNVPAFVLTDNEQIRQRPGETNLARSIARAIKDFSGAQSINSFRNVDFAVFGELSDHPLEDLRQAQTADNPPGHVYSLGEARRERGTPWEVRIETDFAAKREAYARAEQERREAERQRRAELRRMHREALETQFDRLKELDAHGRARFYATLQFEPERLDDGKIDLDSRYRREGSLLRHQVSFAHPARFIGRAEDGLVELREPFYMVVEANGREIESPYRMSVEENRSGTELDGWHIVKVAPSFSFDYEGDTPNFRITIMDAVACETEKCAREMSAEEMMSAIYQEDDIGFLLSARGGE